MLNWACSRLDMRELIRPLRETTLLGARFRAFDSNVRLFEFPGRVSKRYGRLLSVSCSEYPASARTSGPQTCWFGSGHGGDLRAHLRGRFANRNRTAIE